MTIESLLLERYPNEYHLPLRETIASACNFYVNNGLADNNFIYELCSGSESKYWSHVSEALFAFCLMNKGYNLFPHNDGPDILLEINGIKIWIEVICPTIDIDIETGIWPATECGNGLSKDILLRWTHAIKEKTEKLVGSLDGTKEIIGYIEKEIVALDDTYIIAINGYQLRRGPFSVLHGISQYPAAVEAVYALGPPQLTLNRNNPEESIFGHQYRPSIEKKRDIQVPTCSFLNSEYKQISAIWAAELDGSSSLGNPEPLVVIHNPLAVNPLEMGFLPAHEEYTATIGPRGNDIDKKKGCLKSL